MTNGTSTLSSLHAQPLSLPHSLTYLAVFCLFYQQNPQVSKQEADVAFTYFKNAEQFQFGKLHKLHLNEFLGNDSTQAV